MEVFTDCTLRNHSLFDYVRSSSERNRGSFRAQDDSVILFEDQDSISFSEECSSRDSTEDFSAAQKCFSVKTEPQTGPPFVCCTPVWIDAVWSLSAFSVPIRMCFGVSDALQGIAQL